MQGLKKQRRRITRTPPHFQIISKLMMNASQQQTKQEFKNTFDVKQECCLFSIHCDTMACLSLRDNAMKSRTMQRIQCNVISCKALQRPPHLQSIKTPKCNAIQSIKIHSNMMQHRIYSNTIIVAPIYHEKGSGMYITYKLKMSC